MLNISKVTNNISKHQFTPHQADRMPNRPLGRYMNIYTNNLLMKDKKLSQYVNDQTMGALDNYAQDKRLHIFITPFENDLFDDLAVEVYSRDTNANSGFAMKIKDDRHSLADFLSDLNKKVTTTVNKGKKEDDRKEYHKLSGFEKFEMWAQDVSDRIQEYRVNKLQNFADKHRKDSGLKGMLAESIDEVY